MSLAFDFLSPSSPSSLSRDAIMARSISERSEGQSERLETFSSKNEYSEFCGEDRSCLSSPQELIRKLADHLAPGQPAKICIPRLHHALVKRVRSITLRRVRALYNGEVVRAWGDELDALRAELAEAENAAARRAFARAAVELQRRLAASGVPLTDRQAAALCEEVGA